MDKNDLLGDLQHYGIIGLLEAKKKYDPTKGVPWLAFAAYRVRGAMMDQVRKLPMIRIPQEAQQKVKALKEARRELEIQTGQVTTEGLAANLGWTINEVHQVAALPVSMQVASTTDDRGDEGGELGVILADNGPDPEQQTLRRELAGLVHKCLEALPSSEDRLILLGRIVEGLKLRELADMLDCTAENIRLRQKKVETWMQSCLERRGWEKDGWLEIVK